jgi:CDP-glucose 4,6-dehydratase
MAAQPLVRLSYQQPIETYATNVMGTLHLLEAARHARSVRAIVNITTDKCYDNKEWAWGYREDEPMGGHDPYSSSKGCAELVVAAYQRSYFSAHSSRSKNSYVAVATARAGNVIGGGDWAVDRLVPDAIRAFESNQALPLRYPSATRPWQHVLEPLAGYLILAQNLYTHGSKFAGAWNFGPVDSDSRSVKYVVDLLIDKWGSGACWHQDAALAVHEAQLLSLDCTKAYTLLSWRPRWSLPTAIEKIVSWHKAFNNGQDMLKETLCQINDYQNS